MASLVTHPADVVKTHMQVSMPRILTKSSECTKIQVGFAKNCSQKYKFWAFDEIMHAGVRLKDKVVKSSGRDCDQ